MNALARSAAFTLAVLLTLGALGQRLDAQRSGERPFDAGIRDFLQQYSTAFASRDAAAVKKIQPSINVENLRDAFSDMRALEVTIDQIKILSTDAAITRVSCRVTQTLTPKAGSKKTKAVTRVIRLRKQDTGWIIEAFER